MLDGARLVEQERQASTPVRSRRARSTTPRRRSPKRGPAHRSPGRWPVATRAHSAARRSTASPVWLAFCVVFLLGLADFRTAAVASQSRPARAAVVLGLALVLQPREHLHERPARLSAARLPARTLHLDRRARHARARSAPALEACGAARRGASSSSASAIGLNVEDSNVIDVGYAGVIGAQRIADRCDAVRQLSEGGRPQGVRAGRLRRARFATGSSSTAAASRRTRSATRTVRSPTRRTSPATGSAAGRASGTSCPPCISRRSSSTSLCALGLGLVGLRFGGRWLGAALAFAWAAFPFTQYVSMSNTNDAIVPVFLIFGFWLAHLAVGTRGLGRALRLDEVRDAHRRAAVADLSRPGAASSSRARLRRGLPGRHRSLPFRSCCSTRHPVQAAQTFYDRTLKTQINRESPFSLWDWAQYHARGTPRPACRSADSRGPARTRRLRRGVLAAHEDAAAAWPR